MITLGLWSLLGNKYGFGNFSESSSVYTNYDNTIIINLARLSIRKSPTLLSDS